MRVQKFGILTLSVFALGLFLRLILTTIAHHGDLNNNISWGSIALEKGFNGFYGSSDSDDWPYSAPNQPPLTIILFSACVYVWKLIKDFIWYTNWELLIFPSKLVWFWDEKGMDILVKLPSILADLGIGWMIYQYVLHKEKKSQRLALTISGVWLFNPVTWYNSGVWGQTDSIVNILGLGAVFSLLNKKLLKFSILFTLSLLFKGSLAIFIPIIVVVIFLHKYKFKEIFQSIIYSFLTVAAIAIWFHPHFDFPVWLLNLYKNRILPGEIGYLTANAFNFWWLVDSGKILDSNLFFGISARNWGFIIVSLIFVLVIKFLSQKISDKRVFYSLVIVSLSTFLFMTRIHERYLYPFFPYATLLLSSLPNIFILYLITSLVHILNLYHLFWVPSIPPLEKLYLNPLFTNSLSVINILVFISLLRLLKRSKI